MDDGKRWYSDGRFSDVLLQKVRRVWEEGVQKFAPGGEFGGFHGGFGKSFCFSFLNFCKCL